MPVWTQCSGTTTNGPRCTCVVRTNDSCEVYCGFGNGSHMEKAMYAQPRKVHMTQCWGITSTGNKRCGNVFGVDREYATVWCQTHAAQCPGA